VQRVDGIDRQVANVDRLANDLFVNLAFGRNVDDDVAADLGGASESTAGADRSFSLVVLFEQTPGGERLIVYRDSPLRELTRAGRDLTSAADATSATNCVEVRADLYCRVENRRAVGHGSGQSRWGEDDAMFGHGPSASRDGDGRQHVVEQHLRHRQRWGRDWRLSRRHSSRRFR